MGLLGNNIRYLRTKNGLSQDYLAEQLGYKSYTTIQKWESGVSEPPVKKLKELSILFNTDMNEIANCDLTKNKEHIVIKDSKDFPKIINYYNQLNETGKSEATKRVQELTYLPQYTDVSITNEDDIALLKAIEEAPKTQEELERELFEQYLKSDAG